MPQILPQLCTWPAAQQHGGPGDAFPLVPSFARPPIRRPLPDAMAVRRVTVPDSGPVFDDQLPAAPRERPRELGSEPARPPAGNARPASSEAGRRQPAAARRADADWPGQFARVLAETLAGARPARQITPWTTEQARRRIRQLGPLLAAGQQPQARRLAPAVRRVLTCCPAPGVLEMTVVLVFDGRVRALAVRLERDPRPGEPWVCTAVEAA
ncbi:MAG TPA: Rv3235 family protein [Streptosporangiaceae bacterium]|jgi:hypothetical protein